MSIRPWQPRVLVGHARWAVFAAAIASASACSPAGHDIFDDFNTRDTGQYLAVSRSIGSDGSILVQVEADEPEHSLEIARALVRLSYAGSPPSVRVVVDPAHGGTRQVFRWDGADVRVDTSTEGLPPQRSDKDQRTSRP